MVDTDVAGPSAGNGWAHGGLYAIRHTKSHTFHSSHPLSVSSDLLTFLAQQIASAYHSLFSERSWTIGLEPACKQVKNFFVRSIPRDAEKDYLRAGRLFQYLTLFE